jgi:hypothetical protein
MSAPANERPPEAHGYRRVVLFASIGFALLYGTSYFCPHFQVLYDKYASFVPDWLRPLAIAAIGFAFGNALTILFAPKSFLQSPTSSSWLVSGNSSELWIDRAWNRGKCAFLVLVFALLTGELIHLAFFHR